MDGPWTQLARGADGPCAGYRGLVSNETGPPPDPGDAPARPRGRPARCGRGPGGCGGCCGDLTLGTIRICLRYRVTGLAAEAGFFALLSLPPLVLGLVGGVGFVGQWVGSRRGRASCGSS